MRRKVTPAVGPIGRLHTLDAGAVASELVGCIRTVTILLEHTDTYTDTDTDTDTDTHTHTHMHTHASHQPAYVSSKYCHYIMRNDGGSEEDNARG